MEQLVSTPRFELDTRKDEVNALKELEETKATAYRSGIGESIWTEEH